MFSSIYTSMSGLVAYSRGLDVISNNVSNLNTAGFKLSTLTFEDLFYQQQFESGSGVDGQKTEFGAGVDTPGTRLSFAPGELRETASDTDVAIDGNGFFVLLGEGFDGEDTYTRAGSFEFDDEGRLVDQNGRSVAALGGGGGLEEFRIDDLRVSPPAATTRIELTDNLSLSSSQARVEGIEVIDSLAGTNEIDLLLTNNGATTTGSWLVARRARRAARGPSRRHRVELWFGFGFGLGLWAWAARAARPRPPPGAKGTCERRSNAP